MSEFKVNDRVYVPYYGTCIFIVSTNSYNEDLDIYPFMVGTQTFTVHGKSDDNRLLQDIFHATPENHELLEKLYGVEFEAPPVKPTRREIIQAMFKRGDRSVTCWVSDTNENPDSHHTWAFIRSVSDKLFIDKDGSAWRFATPFDRRTGEAITELPT